MSHDGETPGTPVLLGLGANLGEPVAQLARAVTRLRERLSVEAVSAVYRTEPVGYRDQPDFFNLVCLARTLLPPGEVLAAAQSVERQGGRVRTFRDAPRAIDVDVLAYGDRVLESEGLILPHPRLHLRAFVLVPLAEVAPGWRHPLLGLTAAELLAGAGPLERVERWGALPAG